MSRLQIAGIATLQELETYWTLDDVIRANIDLTYDQTLQQAADEATE